MRIVSWNVNGLRAVCKRDFLGWFKGTRADIVCLQEIKTQEAEVPSPLVQPSGYYSFFNCALKKGYSGVAVYTKEAPLKVISKFGISRFDTEGRLLELHYRGFILINIYIPHGGRGKENLEYKLEVYRRFLRRTAMYRNKKAVLIGDFNIAHKEIDLARPKQNQNNIMFTPEERKQIDKLVGLGFTDTFRKFHTEGGHYTWWPYFANARKRNLGWRIDYAFTSGPLTPRVKDAFILPDVMGSDHCPIGIEV